MKTIDKSKEKCASCGKESGFPRAVCWICERPICRKFPTKENPNIRPCKLFQNDEQALICKKCHDKK